MPDLELLATLKTLRARPDKDSHDHVLVTLVFERDCDTQELERILRLGASMFDEELAVRFQQAAQKFAVDFRCDLARVSGADTDDATIRVTVEFAGFVELETMYRLFESFLPMRGYELVIMGELVQRPLPISEAAG